MRSLFVENSLPRFVAGRAASLFGPLAGVGWLSTARWAEVPEPSIPGPRWLKVRNRACGLCGTDVHLLLADLDPRCFPAALPGLPVKHVGHELVAEVIETGAEVDTVRPGDRVALRIDWPSCSQLEIDPPCRSCADGAYMLCTRPGLAQLPLRHTGGGFSPYMVMHRSQPYRIPDGIDDETALLLEPLASAVHGVLKGRPAGDRALVIGAGTIGLLTVVALRALEPETKAFILARHPFQAELAARLGAEVIADGSDLYQRMAQATAAREVVGRLGNRILLGGFDTVYDAVGSDATLTDALRWTRAGGRVVLVGINFRPGRIDYTPVWHQEVTLVGVNCHAREQDGRSSFDIAASILLPGAVRPEWFITHRFPVVRWREAMKTFLGKSGSRAVKIVLDH